MEEGVARGERDGAGQPIRADAVAQFAENGNVGFIVGAGALERGSDNAGQIDDTLDSLEARGLIAREPVSWIESQPQFSFTGDALDSSLALRHELR